MSLPLAFGTTLETVPSSARYLHASAEVVAAAREKLGPWRDKLRVGLAWQGNKAQRSDARRSMPLSALATLLGVPGVQFFSLQKDLTAEERAIADRAGNLVHLGEDFVATAALVEALDLVITVDTSWAHWAGAAGKPTWILLAFAPDWRWLRAREDSPWYPTVRPNCPRTTPSRCQASKLSGSRATNCSHISAAAACSFA
jgi:ADP-heptose:LPS heptosyltransferase